MGDGMSTLTLTPGQHAAVYERGSAILVAAAAGSGKTRVLVERLMTYITDLEHPCDITDFLIITYTRAAAQELRARIQGEIARRIAENPQDKNLQRQELLCYQAQIGTIHSFCTKIIREYAHTLDLPFDFTVMDEDRRNKMKQQILERVIEDAYASIAEDTDFRALVDSVGAGRDDSRLFEMILTLHEKMQSHADPKAWIYAQAEALCIQQIDMAETVWGQELLGQMRVHTAYWQKRLETLRYALAAQGEAGAQIAAAYGESLDETIAVLGYITQRSYESWDAVCSLFPVPFPRLRSLRTPLDPELAETVKRCREGCKKDMEQYSRYFAADSSVHVADCNAVLPVARGAAALTLRLDAAFAAEKKRLGYLDFSDLEHYALALLVDPSTGEKTAIAKELSSTYEEIMVDEYQDVNRVQDMLFTAVSRQGQNLFMVGDVKQSIYRFRLADPGIFLEKYNTFAPVEEAKAQEPRRILLQENFRSRGAVLEGANHVFTNLMSKYLGETVYDERAKLYPRAPYESTEDLPIYIDILTPPPEEEQEGVSKTVWEARHIARKIQTLIQKKQMIGLGSEKRPVQYGDIVILMRSPTRAGPIYRKVFQEMGIPMRSDTSGNYFSSIEIRVICDFLQVIDNPYDDIALISVLRSAIFSYSPDMLSAIALAAPKKPFYTGLCTFSAQGNAQEQSIENEVDLSGFSQEEIKQIFKQTRSFLRLLNDLRTLARDIPISTLVWEIYTRTNMIACCSAMEGGDMRSKRLMAFFELALQYGADRYQGIGGFLQYIEQRAEEGNEPEIASPSQERAVEIYSIHKSKGLEFPIVFLADTARQFNKQDTRDTVLLHTELGLGLKRTDLTRSIEYPTLARTAIAKRLNLEMLSEEMRVLYVAMTRAKEQLYISCSWRQPEKELSELQQNLSAPLAPAILEKAKSLSHWIVQTALLDTEQRLFHLEIVEPVSAEAPQEAQEPPLLGVETDSKKDVQAKAAVIQKRLSYRYPYAAAATLPSKLTATELKGHREDLHQPEDAAPLIEEKKLQGVFRIPIFAQETQGLTSAEKGVALHTVMQHIDFQCVSTPQEVKKEIRRLCEVGRITPKEEASINQSAVCRFFQSPLGRRIQRAEHLWREFRFSMLMDAQAYYPEVVGEQVLMQGILDCCMEEDGKLIIIDFKTDYVTMETISDRAKHYAGQLYAYARAMERILHLPVTETVVYFMGLSKGVWLEGKPQHTGKEKEICLSL